MILPFYQPFLGGCRRSDQNSTSLKQVQNDVRGTLFNLTFIPRRTIFTGLSLDIDKLFITLLKKVDSISSLNKKQWVRIAVAALILIAIPLTIFLVHQQQILKSRALGEGSTLAVTGSAGGFNGTVNPPTTTSPLVNLLLTYANAGGVTPTPTPTTTPGGPTATRAPGQPTSTPSPTPTSSPITLTASPTSVAPPPIGLVTVSWSGVRATDVNWYIRADQNLGYFLYLYNCSTILPPSSSSANVPYSGSCIFPALPIPAISAAYTYTYKLHHISGASDNIVATSNQITVVAPTAVPVQPTSTPIPIPTPPVDCGVGYSWCQVEGRTPGCIPWWQTCG